MKELAEKFKKQFTCLGEINEKYITFKIPTEEEVTRIYKNGEEITKYISYIIQFSDSRRVMASSLSIVFLKEFIELHVNTDMMIKNVKLVELNIRIETVFLNVQTLKVI